MADEGRGRGGRGSEGHSGSEGARVLLVCHGGRKGGRGLDRLLSRLGADVATASGWKGLIASFYPVPPDIVLLDAALLRDPEKDLAQVERISTEVPGLPIVVTGDTSTLSTDDICKLARRGVRGVTGPEDLSQDRFQELVTWRVAGRVLLKLQMNRARPIPAPVADAITQAMVRASGRMTVPALAAQLGYSPRGLRQVLSRAGAPQPQQLISWGRVLWAVHDLCSDPTAQGDRVAWSLGFSGPTVLGNALCRRLGVRINAAREKGLDWAIERFVQESGLCDPPKAPPNADRGG